MLKSYIKIILSLIILTIFILIGFPFEVQNLFIEGLLKILCFGLSFFIIYLVSIEARKINNKLIQIIIKFVNFGYLLLFFLGLFSNDIIKTTDMPDWYNLAIYTNDKGQKVLYQLKETSGSIWDYRDRLVLYEFDDQNIISINWSTKYLNNKWKVYEVEKDSTYYFDFR